MLRECGRGCEKQTEGMEAVEQEQEKYDSCAQEQVEGVRDPP